MVIERFVQLGFTDSRLVRFQAGDGVRAGKLLRTSGAWRSTRTALAVFSPIVSTAIPCARSLWMTSASAPTAVMSHRCACVRSMRTRHADSRNSKRSAKMSALAKKICPVTV